MKRLAILWIVSLLVLLPVALVVGCQQQPAEPTVPTPSPPPEPTAPPKPPKLPEAPQHIVTVLLFEGFTLGFATGHERLEFQGEIRNDSNDTLSDMTAVITVFDKDDKVQGIEFRQIDERTLYPGYISGYSVSMNDYINGVYAELSFELSEPGALELNLGPDVPKALWKPVLLAHEKEYLQQHGWAMPTVLDWCPESPCNLFNIIDIIFDTPN